MYWNQHFGPLSGASAGLHWKLKKSTKMYKLVFNNISITLVSNNIRFIVALEGVDKE